MASWTDRLSGVRSELGVKAPVRVCSTSNITLSGFQTIDGVTLASGDLNLRVLVNGQTDATTNGIYDAASGTWTRSKDFDMNGKMQKGTRVLVNEGTSNSGEYQLTTADQVIVGTSNISFSLRAASNTFSGTAGSTDGGVVTANGTGGNTLKGSNVVIDSSGNITPKSGISNTGVGTASLPWTNHFLVQTGKVDWGNGTWKLTGAALRIGFEGSGTFEWSQNATTFSSLPAGPSGMVARATGLDAANARMVVESFGTGVSPFFTARSARGTGGSPSATKSGDMIAAFNGIGYGATGYAATGRGSYEVFAAEDWSDTAHGTYGVIKTTQKTTTTNREIVRFDDAGRVGVGVTPASGWLCLQAGTTANAPLLLTTGSLLTSPVAGAEEYDGTNFYKTIDTTSGRGQIPVQQYNILTANGSAISTIANAFGANSNISLVANAMYYIEIDLWLQKTGGTTNTVTVTLNNSAAPTWQNILWDMSPVSGIVAPPGTTTSLDGQIAGDTTQTKAITTGSITSGAVVHIRMEILLQNGNGTSLQIELTAASGTVTPLKGSLWSCERLNSSGAGTFAA